MGDEVDVVRPYRGRHLRHTLHHSRRHPLNGIVSGGHNGLGHNGGEVQIEGDRFGEGAAHIHTDSDSHVRREPYLPAWTVPPAYRPGRWLWHGRVDAGSIEA